MNREEHLTELQRHNIATNALLERLTLLQMNGEIRRHLLKREMHQSFIPDGTWLNIISRRHPGNGHAMEFLVEFVEPKQCHPFNLDPGPHTYRYELYQGLVLRASVEYDWLVESDYGYTEKV